MTRVGTTLGSLSDRLSSSTLFCPSRCPSRRPSSRVASCSALRSRPKMVQMVRAPLLQPFSDGTPVSWPAGSHSRLSKFDSGSRHRAAQASVRLVVIVVPAGVVATRCFVQIPKRSYFRDLLLSIQGRHAMPSLQLGTTLQLLQFDRGWNQAWHAGTSRLSSSSKMLSLQSSVIGIPSEDFASAPGTTHLQLAFSRGHWIRPWLAGTRQRQDFAPLAITVSPPFFFMHLLHRCFSTPPF